MASALMETIELAHAENVARPSRKQSYREMSAHARAADPALLPRLTSRSRAAESRVAWTRGTDLFDDEEIWVPYDLVHTDFSSPARRRQNLFYCSSNGLASGNHLLEATCAALYEVIERDATAIWEMRDRGARAERRLVLKSVRDPDCRALLDRLEERGMAVAVWDVTTDLGVPTFSCRLKEAPGNERSDFRAFWGAGCHLSREVAFIRAVTEAAQSRLTYIAGSRDDLYRRYYERKESTPLIADVHDVWERKLARTRFNDMPSEAGSSFEHDRDLMLKKLRAAGIGQVAVVDLTDDRFEIPVVRVIVPGLEYDPERTQVRPSPRARAASASTR
jgi:ribosomal protein S12 methylthiotransferase accessory factor